MACEGRTHAGVRPMPGSGFHDLMTPHQVRFGRCALIKTPRLRRTNTFPSRLSLIARKRPRYHPTHVFACCHSMCFVRRLIVAAGTCFSGVLHSTGDDVSIHSPPRDCQQRPEIRRLFLYQTNAITSSSSLSLQQQLRIVMCARHPEDCCS